MLPAKLPQSLEARGRQRCSTAAWPHCLGVTWRNITLPCSARPECCSRSRPGQQVMMRRRVVMTVIRLLAWRPEEACRAAGPGGWRTRGAHPSSRAPRAPPGAASVVRERGGARGPGGGGGGARCDAGAATPSHAGPGRMVCLRSGRNADGQAARTHLSWREALMNGHACMQ